MLYPAELQALPQAREVTLAQRQSRCLESTVGRPISDIGQEGIGKKPTWQRDLPWSAQINRLCLFDKCGSPRAGLYDKSVFDGYRHVDDQITLG